MVRKISFYSINLNGRNYVGDTCPDGRIEFNWALKKYGTVKPANKGTARDPFFRCRQVPFNTGTLSSIKEPRNYAIFSIKTVFLISRFIFEKDFTV
jgi:hypothetical protein